MTRAVAFLRQAGAEFSLMEYSYRGRHEVALNAAAALQVPTVEVFKTLVFTVDAMPILVLVDAAHRVSTRKLARAACASTGVAECSERDAERHTGYLVGGISPFGTRKTMPVFVDSMVESVARVIVNAGRRGLMAAMSPSQLLALLRPTLADLRA